MAHGPDMRAMLAKHRDMIAFGFVGVTSSLAYMAVVALLSIVFKWQATPAVVAAYAVGTVVSYVGSGAFAFRARMTGANFARFLVVVGISFVANVVIAETLAPLGVHAVVIGAINVVAVGAFNFFCHKVWTFR